MGVFVDKVDTVRETSPMTQTSTTDKLTDRIIFALALAVAIPLVLVALPAAVQGWQTGGLLAALSGFVYQVGAVFTGVWDAVWGIVL